jgi:signal recognition particle receptor subunit beta
MPIVDRRTNSIVLRIVYDGPPEAGKTTNLLRLLDQISPLRRGELAMPGGPGPGDRTQFFDWLDVAGGWIGGRRAQCQLITVPGQIQLARRRQHILETADVVVFVADARPTAAPETQAALRSLQRGLDGHPAVPMILQANKQDLAGAQPPVALRTTLGLSDDVVAIGARANQGEGVRETFVRAIHVAADRARALEIAGALTGGDAATASDLFTALTHAGPLLPFDPPPTAPPIGLVWPGSVGRAAFADLTDPPRRAEAAAGWAPEGALELHYGARWVAHSTDLLRFADLDAGRPTLFDAVRWQAQLGELTPPGRAYTLAPDRSGARLWIVTPAPTPMWTTITAAIDRGDRPAADMLARAALVTLDKAREHGVEVGDLDHLTGEAVPRLLVTPWTPITDRLAAQLAHLHAIAVR